MTTHSQQQQQQQRPPFPVSSHGDGYEGKHHPASADADFLHNARMRAHVRVAFKPLVRICTVLRL